MDLPNRFYIKAKNKYLKKGVNTESSRSKLSLISSEDIITAIKLLRCNTPNKKKKKKSLICLTVYTNL